LAHPLPEVALMERELVLADLLGSNRFLVQELTDRLRRLDAGARDVDPTSGVRQVAVRLRKPRESVLLEHRSDTRRVRLAHRVDAEHEREGDALLARERGEQGVLGAARSLALAEHGGEVAAVGRAAV